MVTIRSSGPTSLSSARSNVVFPASTPPQMMKFLRARTAADRNSRRATSIDPRPTRSSRNTLEKRWRRMAAGPGRDRHDGEQPAAVGELQVERR